MSFSIYIGEAAIDVPNPEDVAKGWGRSLRVHVEGLTREDAPSFPGDGMTSQSNGRHPSYSGMATFVEETGLHDLFFDEEDGLMKDHPGCVVITVADLATVTEARERWQAKPWPTAERIPGWDPNHDGWQSKGEPNPRYDGNLARLLWLEWWMSWALTNCKVPAIHNH